MILDPRAIALQGIGYGATAVALQGYAQIQSSIISGGGGGAAGVASYKLPKAQVFDDEDELRAAIIREDEEILMVIMSAVTSGALKWVH